MVIIMWLTFKKKKRAIPRRLEKILLDMLANPDVEKQVPTDVVKKDIRDKIFSKLTYLVDNNEEYREVDRYFIMGLLAYELYYMYMKYEDTKKINYIN